MFGKKKKRRSASALIKTIEPDGNKMLKMDLTDGHFLLLSDVQNEGSRPYQEDSYGYSNITSDELIAQKGFLSVVADGMGGLSYGKAVSEAVVSGMLDFFNSPDTICRNGEDLKDRAQEINSFICSHFSPDGKINAGSTLACALIHNSILHWLCIGDSRIYLRRNSQLYQINEDHDYLNMLLEEAIFNEEPIYRAFESPEKDALVGCIGNTQFNKADYSLNGLELKSGDTIMICSDGIYNAISEKLLNQYLELTPEIAVKKIEKTVLDKKFQTQDNLTIIVINYN
ncbi:MAG: PP2C family protein-serine/threonine phosphatase [Eubacterium sp.]